MKPTKKEVQEQEYNWRFNRVNSKGEILFSHITNETVNTVRNFLESKNITFKENFNNLFSFFYKLRRIGANVNTENKKKSLIRFRKQKTNLSVFYNINFVLIKKL